MAGKTSSERVSVKGYLIPYLREVALQYCSVKEEGGIMFAFRLREHRRAEIEAFLTLEPSSKPLAKKSQ
jgi:hypothetical protein